MDNWLGWKCHQVHTIIQTQMISNSSFLPFWPHIPLFGGRWGGQNATDRASSQNIKETSPSPFSSSFFSIAYEIQEYIRVGNWYCPGLQNIKKCFSFDCSFLRDGCCANFTNNLGKWLLLKNVLLSFHIVEPFLPLEPKTKSIFFLYEHHLGEYISLWIYFCMSTIMVNIFL